MAKATLIKDIAARLPLCKRVPSVGTVGDVLAVRPDGHLLIKWPGRNWPISVGPDEVTHDED